MENYWVYKKDAQYILLDNFLEKDAELNYIKQQSLNSDSLK